MPIEVFVGYIEVKIYIL